MKSQTKSLKIIALLLSVVFLNQACAIYGKSPSLEYAISKEKPVIIKTVDRKWYDFNDLFMVNDELWGVTNRKYPALANNEMIYNDNSKYYQVNITDLDIEKILVIKVSGITVFIIANLILGLVAGITGFSGPPY